MVRPVVRTYNYKTSFLILASAFIQLEPLLPEGRQSVALAAAVGFVGHSHFNNALL